MDNKIFMIYDRTKNEYLTRVTNDKINEGEFKIVENNIILNKEYENCYHNLELIIEEKYDNFIIPINNIKKRYEREVINFVDKKTMDYKSYVGNPKHYDLIGKIVFDLLKNCGLKPEHKLLDIGCGSLRVGEYILKYLKTGMYFGIEPNRWLIDTKYQELKNNGNDDLLTQFVFNTDPNFNLKVFNETFDFILANSIFIHACKNQIEKCFDEVMLCSHIGSKFIFNYIEGKDNEKKEWTYPSHIFYSKNYIEELLKKHGFVFEYLKVKYPGKQKFILAVRR